MTRSPPMMMMKPGSSQYNPLYSRRRPSSPPPTSKPIRRWDVLLLTAGNPAQCHYFSHQLEKLAPMLKQYCVEWYPTYDQHPNMGSGLATAFAAKFIRDYYHNDTTKMGRVLLIHAGGFSKRLPHVAPFGKVFAMLPNGRTILEEKLQSFRLLPDHLSDGLFVASSDTDEKLDLISEKKFLDAKNAEIILFGHHSTVQVGTQHGVFILEDVPSASGDGVSKRLKKVLQKPTVREMKLHGAEISPGTVITDSTFFLSQKVAYQLAVIADTPLPYFEICCYADFMRPLGTESNQSYIDKNDEKSEWQLRFYKMFKPLTEKTVVIVDEKATFSHFGTTTEFLNNIADQKVKRAWGSLCEDVNIPSTSFVEFSVIAPDTKIPEYTLLSHVSITSPHLKVPLPINSTIFTWKLLDDKKFVTIILSNTVDVKNSSNTKWFNHPVPVGPLFEAKIFPVSDTPEDSLLSTLYATKNGIKGEGMSIKEAIKNVDVEYMISRRDGQQS